MNLNNLGTGEKLLAIVLNSEGPTKQWTKDHIDRSQTVVKNPIKPNKNR